MASNRSGPVSPEIRRFEFGLQQFISVRVILGTMEKEKPIVGLAETEKQPERRPSGPIWGRMAANDRRIAADSANMSDSCFVNTA